MPLLAFTFPNPWKSGKGEPDANNALPSVWVYAWPFVCHQMWNHSVKVKVFFFLPNSKWEKLKLNLDLLCCTLSHAGRVGKCKDDRHLVEAAKVIFASTLFQNSLMLYYKTYICPPSRFFSSHWNHCYAHLATWPPGHLYSSGHLLTWPCP